MFGVFAKVRLKNACMFALPTAALFVSLCHEAVAQNGNPGNVVGAFDIRTDAEQVFIRGWACQQGVKDSIAIHIYADDSLVLAGKADLESEPAVNRNCQDSEGGKHRFWIELPNQALATYQGKKLIVHGIRARGAVANAAIGGSGTITVPPPVVQRVIPERYPRLSGEYVRSAARPSVFTNKAELDDMVKRINTPGTFSAESFARLVSRIKSDLAAKVAWDAVYTGCDMEIYLRVFSYEPKPAYGNDRSEDQLSKAMNLPPGYAAPHGAAVAAARMALYAALVKAGASTPAGAPLADDAIKLAKRILLAWADHGFRDEQGKFRPQGELCDLYANGEPKIKLGDFVGGLTHSRGVVYSVHAQDLLEGLGAFLPEEEARVNAFHREMYNWIRGTHNKEIELEMQGRHSDEAYNNQNVSHLTALIALARLLNDKNAFEATLYGGQGETAVKMPWVMAFDVIYGPGDRPFARISPNSSDDPLKSTPSYVTRVAAAGEINDRYRNENPMQSIGYAMGSLEWLFDATEVLRNSGLDAYGYRGAHGQSMEMATEYYGCYGRHVGFYNTITAQNAQPCPDYQQYIGKVVNAVDARIVIGAYRFPKNRAITDLDASAKKTASSGPFSLDPILFGKWLN